MSPIEEDRNDPEATGQLNALEAVRDLVNRMPGGLGIYYIYEDGRVELGFLNDQFYTLMDSTREERKAYIGFSTFDSLWPDDRTLLIEELQEAIRKQRMADVDIRVRDKRNQYRWLHVQASIAETMPDKTAMYLLFTDIDESKREHLNLMESHRAVEIASENGDIGLWVYDLEKHSITQSFQNSGGQGYASIIENGPEEIIQTGGIHPEDIADYRAMYKRIQDGETKSESVVRFYNRRKHKFEWTQMILTREENPETKQPTVLGFSQNVDMQKVAEIRYERENVLRKELVKDAVAYYRINLSNKMVEEFYSELADMDKIKLPVSTDELIAQGMFEGVYEKDRELFHKMLLPEHMLDNYNHGKMTESFLYRREIPGQGLHWLRGSVSKLRRVSSEDIVAFFTAIDVDEEQSNQLISQSILGEEIENVDLLNLYTNQTRIVMRNHSKINFERSRKKEEYLSYPEYKDYLMNQVLSEDADELQAFLHLPNILESLETKNIIQLIYRISVSKDEIRWKKIRIFFLDESCQSLIFAQRDITDLYVEEERRRQELAEITNAAFMQHVYVHLDQMLFYGNERADKLFPDHLYEKLYLRMRELILNDHDKHIFDEFTAPEKINHENLLENKLESTRLMMNWPQPDFTFKPCMIEVSRMFSHVQGERIASFLCRDVTEDAAVLKEALDQAQSASRAKGEFLSLMSHEIRTPLNAIIGYQDMVRDEIANIEKNENAVRFIEKSQIAANHLLSILNDVLDISSIESGRMQLEEKVFDLSQMVNSLQVMFQEEANSKGVRLEMDLTHLQEHQVIGDSTRVQQVLQNLISNAIKFTPKDGLVRMELHQRSVQDEKTHLQFIISDTGIGMDREFMKRMFIPFEQERMSIDRTYGGTGLGLSISNNLVELMGGLIEVESEVGKGTVFTVTLAFGKYKASESHLRALVVIEDTLQGKLLEEELKRKGVKCDIVASKKKALRRIESRREEHPYELCLLDENIVTEEGNEIIEQIQEKAGEKTIKIVRIEKSISAAELNVILSDFYKDQKEPSEETQREINFEGMHVLLAEDNEMNMEISLDILGKAGMNITPAVNGKEAVDIFTASKPGTFDAILMDIQMPVMDGYEATRTIRECGHPQAAGIPIVAMTANAFTSDITAALAAGMNDHVSKPINRKRLFEALSRLI